MKIRKLILELLKYDLDMEVKTVHGATRDNPIFTKSLNIKEIKTIDAANLNNEDIYKIYNQTFLEVE